MNPIHLINSFEIFQLSPLPVDSTISKLSVILAASSEGKLPLSISTTNVFSSSS